MKLFLSLGYFAILGAMYALVYYLNHKTPRPKGCENLKKQCEGCCDHSCCNHLDPKDKDV